MRIVIDLQGAQTESSKRGIGRYSLAIAQAIARHRGEHEVVLGLNGVFPDTIERDQGRLQRFVAARQDSDLPRPGSGAVLHSEE